ncbi:MAG: hypothetical protein H7Y11_01185 [Armatimonadetes bacterium]|nr:hypothetical protein [Anaerolineae bacterium]
MATDNNVYILITQCLQNGFFLADENRLCLPKDVAHMMLVGNQSGYSVADVSPPNQQNQRQFDPNRVRKGPLYQFFDAVTGKAHPERKHDLHIINIRDWHAPSAQYDEERSLYGVHCEANTWEAESIEGFEPFLKPWGSNLDFMRQAQSLAGYRAERVDTQFDRQIGNGAVTRSAQDSKLRFYDVRSDSVFDFKPPTSDELKAVLTPLKADQGDSHLEVLLDHLIPKAVQEDKDKRVYVVVVGVYTDIKIKTLVIGLRTRYEIDGLFISDVLTDAPTLERQLQGLDYIAKVAGVQVLHSLNDVVSVLNPGATHIIPDGITALNANYRDYANHYVDRQYILSYQDAQLRKYIDLTGKRSLDMYDRINVANTALLLMGIGFIILTFIATAASVIGISVPPQLALASILATATTFFGYFFSKPTSELRNNLASLVRLRNYLETYSSVTALLRHHLTQVERLQPKTSGITDFETRAKLELWLVREQLDIIHDAADRLRYTFYDLAPDAKVSTDEQKANTSKPPPSSPNKAESPMPEKPSPSEPSNSSPPSDPPSSSPPIDAG